MNRPSPPEDASRTLQYYEDNAQSFYKDTLALDLSHVYRPFLDLLPPPAHILDAGCGSGRDSLFFLKQGYRVTALDASPALARLASELIGQPVLNLSFSELEMEAEFDGLWANASLLHIPRSEISAVLARLGRALKPGGLFYLSFKHGPTETFRNGRWFNDYDEPTFWTLLSRHPELRLLSLSTSPDKRPDHPQPWLNIFLRKEPV